MHIPRQSLLSLHMTKSYVRTATRSTLKVEANLTQILNFKANFHTEFEPFFKKKIYANNGGHFKIVSIKIKNSFRYWCLSQIYYYYYYTCIQNELVAKLFTLGTK